MFLAILLLAFFIAKPFLPAIVTGVVITYLAYPLYEKTLKRVKNRNLASLIISVFVVLLITLPLVSVLGLLSKEAYDTYTTLNQQNLGTNFMKIACRDESLMPCRALRSIASSLPNENLDYYLQITIKKITEFIIINASKFLASIPSIMLNFFVMIFIIYYLLKDGNAVALRIKKMMPLKESEKQAVLDSFHSIIYAVFYGNIAIAVLQGILGIIGFAVLGVPSPFLWGFVMMLFALIPYFGTAIIWLPAALNLIFIGYLQSDSSSITRGVILVIYGIAVISLIDNILKPRLIGSKAKVHPILVLIGVMGGLSLFGFIGLILGPLMLALLMTFMNIYEKEKHEFEKYF